MSNNDFQNLWETMADNIKDSSRTYKEENSLSIDFFALSDKNTHEDNITDFSDDLLRFSCGNEIARGGMGIIFSGHQNSLHRTIAIKKLTKDLQSQDDKKKMFLSEAMVTAYLDHPNIIPVYDLYNEENEVQLAMKLIKGTSWAETISEYSLEKNLQILLQVCNAIAFAHSKGIIHCDLKPENIMIGEFGEILVMDWGIAVSMLPSSVARHKDQITKPMGTPVYFSPELAKGKGVDIGPWTDIYLLGAILCEILIGKPPHHTKTILMTLLSAGTGTIPSFPDSIPQKLVTICCTALDGTKEKRYASIRELQKEIENFLQHSQSILLAQQGYNTLQNCKITDKNAYDLLTEAYFDFRQSLKLWKDNEIAKKGKELAYVKHAQAALKKDDFNLAETLRQKLSDKNQEKNKLKEEIQTTRSFKRGKEVAQKLFKLSLFFSAVIVLKIIIEPLNTNQTKDIILNATPSLMIAVLATFFIGTCYFFYQNKLSFKTNIHISMLFEGLGALCLFTPVFFTTYSEHFSVLGVFPSALFILFVNILIPYTWKQALVSKIFVSLILSGTILTFYSFATIPPQSVLYTLVSQISIVSIISVLLRIKTINFD